MSYLHIVSSLSFSIISLSFDESADYWISELVFLVWSSGFLSSDILECICDRLCVCLCVSVLVLSFTDLTNAGHVIPYRERERRGAGDMHVLDEVLSVLLCNTD